VAGPLARAALFAAGVALFGAALKAANALPALIQPDVLRRYASLEEARAALRMENPGVPSYFPEELGWPPSVVLAQGRPFPALVMEFERARGRGPALVIARWAAGRPLGAGPIRLARTGAAVRYALKGREFLLRVGITPAGEAACRVGWTEGRFRTELAGKVPPAELIRVAESMLR